MAGFMKKLVEKASMKKPGGFSDALKPDDLNPRLVFHYGIQSGSTLLANDSIQQILAISTKNGQIKLFGKDGSQALLESSEAAPSKFLSFIENQGVLLNVNVHNHIEIWDIDTKCLASTYHYEKEITSFVAMKHAPYLYVGDSTGVVSVLKLDKNNRTIELMKYHIPLSESHGKKDEVGSDIAVKYILPQPTAESKRVLIIYSDGVIALWSIQQSKMIYRSGGVTILILQETKKVTAACWACLAGTKVAIGYSNGDILLWSVPRSLDSKIEQSFQNEICSTPICKLNLGYKADKIPITKMKWVDADEKSSRLYVLGCSEYHSANLMQVVLLNEHTESRTIKLGLNPPESLLDFEITTSTIEQNKHKRDCLFLLGRSSRVYFYDDSLIQRYLLQLQTKSSPSLPKEVMIKLPYGDSSITVTEFITEIPCMPSSADEDLNILAKNSLPLFPFEKGGNSNSISFSPFSRAKSLFITGHGNGTINFWDASCPVFLPITSITQQSDNDFSVSGIPLTALYFNYDLHILVSGDQSGTVRIYTFKSEAFVPQNSFISFQGSSKKGSNLIRIIKVLKVNGAVTSINTAENMKQLTIGTDQGYVSLIDPEGTNILHQRKIVSEFSTGIVSAHFETCIFNGFEKNVFIVATKDSSVLTLDRDTGNQLSTRIIRPKKPSQALFTQILNGQGISGRGLNTMDVTDNSMNQSLVLLCSEKAVYIYSLSHLVQGIKKVLYKKKFHSSCYWASTFGSPDIGLILIFASGKIEIRTLPELSLLKELLIRGLTFPTSRPSSISDITMSSSIDGELVIVNGCQEIFFISTLNYKEAYRLLDSVSRVFNKDLYTQGVISPPSKKKGIFGSVIKDDKATKSKYLVEVESENSRRSTEELSTIFYAENFPTDPVIETKIVSNDENADLDIDDIEIEDLKEKPKGHPMVAGLNKLNITSKFQAIKGKLKHGKVKNDKVLVNEEPNDKKTGDVDQIKKKYGYASSSSESSNVADIARTKLSENMKKLQGINLKTNEMQDTARSFSSMAKEVLRFVENDKKIS